MYHKLNEINLRAQESLALYGNYDKELEELSGADIPQEEIIKYRIENPELSYIYQKLKEKRVLIELGFTPQLMLRCEKGMNYSKELEDKIDKFIAWKPDYNKYKKEYIEEITRNFKSNDDVSQLGILQGARVSQIRLLKEIIKLRRAETSGYYGDRMFNVKECEDLPYFKFKKIMELIENLELKDDVELNFDFKDSMKNSFTRYLEKARIQNKRWTMIVNGNKPMKNDIYLALVVCFYLGIARLEDIESFLHCFGISLYSPAEMINTVPIEQIRKAINVGMHYDNILYYLRMQEV